MKRPRIIILVRLIMLFSLLLFAASLPLNCFTLDNHHNGNQGFLLLITGWVGLLAGVPVWLANPAIALSWVTLLHRRTRFASVICAIVAFFIALSFLLIAEMHVGTSGNPKEITQYGPGYWTWIASIGTMVVGATAIWHFDKSEIQRNKVGHKTKSSSVDTH